MSEPISQQQLMRLIDGEVTPDERERLERLVQSSSEAQRELRIFEAMGSDLRELSFAAPELDHSIWAAVQRRIARPIGWGLFVVGLVVWIAYGVHAYVTTPGVLWTKLATGAVAFGILALLADVVIDRLRELSTDPYRDVHR